MQVQLAYGRSGLIVSLPEALVRQGRVTVVEPRYAPPLADASGAVARALMEPLGSPPLSQRAPAGSRVGVVVNDLTRPTPYDVLLPALLEAMPELFPRDVTFFVALGTHRRATDDELREILGPAVLARHPIVQNDAFERARHVSLGQTSRGNEALVDSELARCDLRIYSGFIEPHFFAGFSGGAKALMPGMAAIETVLQNHGAQMVGDPRASWGVIEGNPIAEEVREVAKMLDASDIGGESFLLNVTLDRQKRITGVFAGDVAAAHDAGCAFAREAAMVEVARPFDIVVSSAGGYPLDLNLYQTVKGMSAAARVVRAGGDIIIASSCWDGLPEHGCYASLLREASSPRELLDRIVAPGFRQHDQWEAQVQAMVQLHADVHLYSDNLDDAAIEAALLSPCRDIEVRLDALLERAGDDACVCVLPEGPQTIAYLAQ